MDLLERADDLAVLDDASRHAADGVGCVVVISGEAGIGKSALLARAFGADAAHRARVLWGACDPLFTPRPLGPLHDAAHQAGGKLLAATSATVGREVLFATLIDELKRPPGPVVLVVEDAHWADEATLDMLRFLGRRIHRTPALLVVTYRDDEVGASHPLRGVIGDLPSTSVRRIRLSPLSAQAVDALAHAAGRPAQGLHTLTSGNPFFVTEALAADHGTVPVTVSDAVEARTARLSSEARAVMDLAAVVPPRIERWLVDALLNPTSSAIDECRAIGMVQGEDGSLAFRHELARRAIEDALPADRRRALNAKCLDALLNRPDANVSVARLVHHADHAGDTAALTRLGPIAAAQASAVGAHREAVLLYERVLRVADQLPARERAVLLEQYSYECYLMEPIDVACSARAEALALWRTLGDRLREGDTLRWLSRLSWFRGVRADAERYAAEAVSVLEQLPPGHELAMAYSNRAQLAMLSADVDSTIEWGARATAIAEPLGDTECLLTTLISVGTAEHTAGRPGGTEKLERALATALSLGLQEHAVRTYVNLATNCVKKWDYDRAEVFLRDGLAYCEERDMNSWSLYMLAWRAHLHFERGDWTSAADDASAVLAHPRCPAISRIHALVALARVRMHRRDPGWQALLDEARDLAIPTGEIQRVLPVACARAESAWLLGDLDRAGEEAVVGWALTNGRTVRSDAAELALWLRRANRVPVIESELPAVIERQLAGDWRAAADEWKRLGCPYQRALALAESDDEQALRESLMMLEQFGSEPGAAFVRRRLRSLGARGVPRGDRPSTRKNPARLTTRQLEILALVCQGRRDAEIAEQLFLSTKTVGHHVSAIFDKLGVRSRAEATTAARVRGILAL